MKYTVIIERGPSSYGAYAPDLPGCVAVAETHDEVVRMMHQAIEMHLESLRENGEPVPPPCSSFETIEVAA